MQQRDDNKSQNASAISQCKFITNSNTYTRGQRAAGYVNTRAYIYCLDTSAPEFEFAHECAV
jgi:hypothetical protein